MIYLDKETGKEFFVHSLNVNIIIDGTPHNGVLFTENSLDTGLIVQKLKEFDDKYINKDKYRFREQSIRRREEFLKKQEERKEYAIKLKQESCDHIYQSSIIDDENGNRCIKKVCKKCLLMKVL